MERRTRNRIVGALLLISVLVGCLGLGSTAAGAATVDGARSAEPAPTSSPCPARVADRTGAPVLVGGVIAAMHNPGSTGGPGATGTGGSTTPDRGLYGDLVEFWQTTVAEPAPSGC